jgi:hypothetical protein
MSEEIRRAPQNATSAGRGPAADLRASDADREQLADELRDHAVAGRLDTDELEERLQGAYAARTTGELAALRRDLPATPEQLALAHRERRVHLIRRSVQETSGSLGVFVVCGVIWAANGASGFFWPVFVLIGCVLLAARTGWDLFGPAADLDAVEARLDAERERHRSHRERHDERRALHHARHQQRWDNRRDRLP